MGASEANDEEVIDLNQFVMESTERGQDADKYIRELWDNDRFKRVFIEEMMWEERI